MACRAKALVVFSGPFEEDLPARASVPRQLDPVANRPVLAHVLDQIAETGIEEVGLVVSDDSIEPVRAAVEDGRAWGLRARYLLHEPRLGAGDAILAAEGFVEDSLFLMHTGDCVVDGSLEPLLARARQGLDGLVVVHRRGAAAPWADVDGARLTGRSRLPLHLLMEAAAVPAMVLGPGVLGVLRRQKRSWRGQIELSAAIDDMRSGGGEIELHSLPGWRFGGSVEDLLSGNRALLDRLVTRYTGPELRDSRVELRAMIHDSARIENSVIRGPSVIGPGAYVADSHIGPYSSIGAGAVVDGAEVEDLIVGDGAVVAKLDRRLAASVIGPGARLSRDFGVSDALRVRLGARSEIVWS